ncbi:PAS domain S-box protein [Mariprofundus erugo]|uniref:histidine kinase n=1 Tax=Mariprofundus erugo TaxID=2528639 RepID=A0A5R9GNN4_9PROT|nr:PAS domain S-box protein [Mariprofundus erugo]TLS67258.1 PAS domain S-box protein [Mariprofundus erugo]
MKKKFTQPAGHHLLQNIIEEVPIRIFWKDREGRYLGCNALFARDAGYSSAHELIGKNDFDMGWREQAEAYRSDDFAVMASGEPKLGFEEPQTTPDGQTIWLRTSKVPLRNEQQEICGILGIYDDITAQKQAELLLQQTRKRHEEAQRIAHLGHWRLDLLTRELQWSDEVFRMFGVQKDGSHPTYDSFLALVHPDDRAYVDRAYHDSLSGGGFYDIEHRLCVHPDVVIWVNERCETTYSEDGTPLYSIGTVLDITDRKRIEEQLQDSEARFRNLVEQSPLAIQILSTDGVILQVNRAWEQMWKVPFAALADYNMLADQQLVATGVMPLLQRAFAGEEIRIPEMQYDREATPEVPGSGGDLWVRTYAYPLRDEAGAVCEVVLVQEDVSLRRQVEIELRESLSLQQATLEATADGILVVGSDGKWRGYNQNFVEMWKFTPEILASGDDERALQYVLDQLVDPQAFIDRVMALYSRPDEISLDEICFSDGRVFERYSKAQRIDGAIVGRVWSFRDITDRCRAEERLRGSEERLRLALDAARQAWFDLDIVSGEVVVSSEYARMIGYEPGEFQTSLQNWLDHIHEEDRPAVERALARTMDSCGPESIEYRRRRGDGGWEWIRSVGEIIERDQSGKPLRMIGIHTDINAYKLAEAALKGSEERFALAMAGANDGLWDWDLQTDVVYYSPRWFGMLGYDEDELPASIVTWTQLVHPDDKDRVLARVSDYLEGREGTFEVEMRMLHKDGHEVYVLSRASKVVRDEDRRPVRLVGTHVDISERKAAERKLVESEQSYRGIFNSLHEAVYILDEKGIFLDVNRGAEKMYGFPRDYFIGKNPGDLSVPNRNDMEQVAAQLQLALHGQPQSLEFWAYNSRGEAFPKEVHLYPGNYFGRRVVIAVATDISERKKSEMALHASEERLQLAQEIGQVGIWDWNPQTGVLYWTDQTFRMFGYEPGAIEPTFELFLQHVHPDDRQMLYHAVQAALSQGEKYDVDCRFMDRDGHEYVAYAQGQVIFSDEGQPVRMLGTFQDITGRKQVEGALQRSGAFLGKIFDNASEGISVCQACDEFPYVRFTLWNGRMTEMTGYTIDQINELGWYQSMYPEPEQQARAIARMERMREGDNLTGEEWEVTTGAGEKRIFSISTSTIVTAEGEPAVVGLMHDVTERKQTAEALIQAAEFRGKLMDQASEGIVLWRPQASGEPEFISWNPRMQEITGYTQEEINRLGWLRTIYASESERDKAGKTMRMVLAGDINRGEDFEIVTRQGERRHVHISSSLVAGSQREQCVLAVVQDITESKRQQALLEASRKRFSTLFDSSSDAIFILDTTGKFIDVNKTAYTRLGYSKDEMLAMHVAELDPPEFAVMVPDRMAKLVQTGYAVFESAHYRADGTIMPVEINARLIELDEQNVILSVIRDISERKEFEEQLRQSQKMEAIGTLVGGIAHDFNNMLAAMQGNIYLARMEMEPCSMASERLNNIEKLGERAAEMVQQLLTFARRDAVSRRNLVLNSFMKEAYKLASAAIPENIDHHSSVCDELLVIHGDATQLQQVLMNLLNNAVDAVAGVAAPGIRCALTAYQADREFAERHPELAVDQFACITVADNGHGIAPDAMAKIFEPFYTTKEVGKGTGLGLAMLYGAVQNHGGVVEVESQPGRGTSFSIYLPLMEDSEAAGEAGKSVCGGGHSETILLVDDEVSVLETTCEVLESMGYRVLTASNGEEAFALFMAHAGEVDLIISDVVMPKMGGVELLRSVRRYNEQLPFMLVTGYDRDHVIGVGAPGNHCQILNKPFNFDVLSRSIQSLVRHG